MHVRPGMMKGLGASAHSMFPRAGEQLAATFTILYAGQKSFLKSPAMSITASLFGKVFQGRGTIEIPNPSISITPLVDFSFYLFCVFIQSK